MPFRQFVRERITERFQSAINEEEETPDQETLEDEVTQAAAAAAEGEPAAETETANRESRIQTTEEETEAYHIVKAMLRNSVAHSRIHGRDTISYFGILLDNNNRKPICRLHFNNPNRKYIGLFDEEKKEERVSLQDIDEIYNYEERLKATLANYKPKENKDDE